MISQNGYPLGVITRKIPETMPQLNRGVPIETADQHALWSDALDPQKIGATVDDGLGLAGAGAGQDQQIAPCGSRYQFDLGWIGQVRDDPLVRLSGSRMLEQFRLGAEARRPNRRRWRRSHPASQSRAATRARPSSPRKSKPRAHYG